MGGMRRTDGMDETGEAGEAGKAGETDEMVARDWRSARIRQTRHAPLSGTRACPRSPPPPAPPPRIYHYAVGGGWRAARGGGAAGASAPFRWRQASSRMSADRHERQALELSEKAGR
eukprot:gene4906-14655_t